GRWSPAPPSSAGDKSPGRTCHRSAGTCHDEPPGQVMAVDDGEDASQDNEKDNCGDEPRVIFGLPLARPPTMAKATWRFKVRDHWRLEGASNGPPRDDISKNCELWAR